MKLSMHRFQTLLIDVGINLRRRNIGVAEHLLNDAQVRAVAQQVGREAVPEQMRINIFFPARVARFFLHDLSDSRCRSFSSALAQKYLTPATARYPSPLPGR